MADWAAEGYLEGLDDDAERAERTELLDWLRERGFTDADLRRGHDDGLLPYIAAERVVMGGPPALTVREIAERADLDPDVLQRMRRALGLAAEDLDAPVHSEAESPVAFLPGAFHVLGFSEEQMLGIVRVLGRGLGAAAQTMRAAALETTLRSGATEREVAEAFATQVEAVMPSIGPLLEQLMRLHLRGMLRTEAADLRTGRLPDARDVTVAFADLVGFTRLGEAVEPAALSAVADQLSHLASDAACGPVRFVKQLGDGVMLVAPEAQPLLESCFDLADAAREQGPGFPELRIGVAAGQAAQRSGDWFGRPVNLASRISGLARAGSTLATEEVREAIGDDAVEWSFAGSRSVKGVGSSVRLHRARRPTPD